MYSKQYRLKKKYQFNYVYRAGRSFGGKFVVVYAAPSKNKNVKLGVSVSKKVGGAVVRNRIKRRITEILRSQISYLNKNYNIIVVARSSAADAKFESLRADLLNLLKKANLYRADL